jgi:predicted transcriptional regulator
VSAPVRMSTFPAKLPEEHLEELRRLAAADDRTVASLVRLAVREYLDRNHSNREEPSNA